MITKEQAQDIEQMAQENNGKCSHCHQTIAIYRTKVNKQMAIVLKRMRNEIDRTGENKVNFNKIDLPFRLLSQRSKMRQHGLIAKYKIEGRHVANTWLITKKGGDFLRGVEIPKTVVVYDNTVLGHDDGMISIDRLADEMVFEKDNITTAEASVAGGLRERRTAIQYRAEYRGYSSINTPFTKGCIYQIEIDDLQIRKPITVIVGQVTRTYNDYADFQKHWEILK